MYPQQMLSPAVFRRKTMLLAGLLCCLLLGYMMVLHPGKASAMSASDIPASKAPLDIRQDIADHCNAPISWTSVMEEWISAPGSPTATSVNVPYGTTSVKLQMNYMTYRCVANIKPTTQAASIKINDTNPNIPALIGRVDDFSVANGRFAPNSQVDYRSGVTTLFNYTIASPGLVSTNDVIITVTSQGTLTKNGPIYGAGAGDSSYNCDSTYSSCNYCALVGNEYQHPTSDPHNFDPAVGYCKNGPGSFRIRVNVVDPAQLDGVKIDDSKSGPYGGDDTNDAYMDLPVTVSGVGSTGANPFYFNKSGSDQDAIPVDSNGTSHTVSVDTSGLGGGWAMAGYSFCDATAVADCSTSNLEYGGKYFTATSASSFSYNFISGHTYHMRWIFKDLISTSCGSLGLNPATVDMTTVFSAHPTVNLGTTAYKPTNSRITLTISSDTTGATWTYGPVTKSAPVDASGEAGATFSPIGPITRAGDYTATWVYDADNNIGMVCSAQIPVVNLPYLTVYGGDTMVGAMATSTPGTCYSGDPEAGAYSWNNHGNGYLGAGSQYAVMVLGQIQDYASNLGGNGSAQDPKKLSFANTIASATNAPSGLYGGKFGAAPAGCDLVSDLLDKGIAPNGSESDIPASVPTGTSKTVFAQGNINIMHDVKYAGTSSWSNMSDIPSFRLVVIGNIYIDKSVGQLDGLYIALPDASGNGGNIYTCATKKDTAADTTDKNYFSDCEQQLVINGAFAAKQVQFLRTYGSIGRAKADTLGNSSAAEQFNYSPEVWLPRGNNDPSMQYDSITGLPPVL